MAQALMIIAPEAFRDEEYARPREVLQARGAEVVTASTRPGVCTGTLGMTAEATLAVADADPADFGAIIFIGGAGSAVFFNDPQAHELARSAHETGRVVAAICIAPSTLARAGLLDGVRATAFASQRQDLTAHGAVWTGAPVVVDGRIITADGPDAAHDFGGAIADALGLS